MTTAGEPKVCAFTVDGTPEESFSAPAVDFARDILLP
jgi:hypothetical protein